MISKSICSNLHKRYALDKNIGSIRDMCACVRACVDSKNVPATLSVKEITTNSQWNQL